MAHTLTIRQIWAYKNTLFILLDRRAASLLE